MIGFRGASRYSTRRYARASRWNARRCKRVRDEMGLINVKLMIPFCRAWRRARRVLEAMAEHGLRRGVNGLRST